MNTGELKQFLEKIKNDKKTMLILLIGLIGMLMVLFSGDSSDKNASKEIKDSNNVISSEYELAEQIEKLIESIDGAGKCKAMITYNSYEETVYAQNENKDINADGEERYTGEYIILDSGSSESGLALKIISPEIKGVAIVCQGGDNPIIKEQIISAISALFNISSNRISIAVMA